MSFQITSKSIYSLQNEFFSLKMILSQRNIYSEAKNISLVKSVIVFVYCIFSIVSSYLNNELLTAICFLYALLVSTISKYFDNYITQKKKCAADIQQAFDTKLYSKILDCDNKLWGILPSQEQLVSIVNNYDKGNVSSVVNWYNDYSSFSGYKQIFYCQCENIRWNVKLYESYKKFIFKIAITFSVLVFTCFFTIDLTVIRFLCFMSYCMPVGDYLFSLHRELKLEFIKFQELTNIKNDINKKFDSGKCIDIFDDLIQLQNKIRLHRETSFLIPDWYYKFYQKNYQEIETKIADDLKLL